MPPTAGSQLLLLSALLLAGCDEPKDPGKEGDADTDADADAALCADGTWSGWTDTDGLVFVSTEGSDNSADGSPERPYESIKEALFAFRDSDDLRIAVGKGDFYEDFGIKRPQGVAEGVRPKVEIAGCGVTETHINPPPDRMLSVSVTGPVEGRLARMSFEWGWSALLVLEGAHATVEDLLIQEAHHRAVSVVGEGSQLTLRDTLIQQTGPRLGHSPEGWGISVVGGRVDLENVTLLDNGGFSIFGDRGSLFARNVQISDTRNQWQPGQGTGIYLMHMAEVQIQDCAISRSVAAGIHILDVLDSTIEGCVITDTLGDTLGNGDGIVVRKTQRPKDVGDRGVFSTRILRNTVSGSARLDIAVQGVNAEIEGNKVEGAIHVDPSVTLRGTDTTLPLDLVVTPLGAPKDRHGRPPPGGRKPPDGKKKLD